jgi:hypothetical protein
MALAPASLPQPTARHLFLGLITGLLAVLLLQDSELSSSSLLPFPLPFLSSSPSTTRTMCPRDPPSLPVGNRRRPRNVHPVPVLGPPLSPTDSLSSPASSLSFLTDPPDRSFPEKYLVVARIRWGRVSNARLLVGDMAGLGIVLNRTVILPHLDACGAEGDEVWDLDALRVPGILSGLGLDVRRLCAARPGDRLYAEPPLPSDSQDDVEPPVSGFFFGKGHNPWEVWGVPNVPVLGLVPANESRWKWWTKEDALSSEPARSFFSDGLRADSMEYMTPGLADQLAAHSGARCLFLDEQFQSFSWAQFRDAYYRVQSSLLPHPSVRSLVRVFLARAGLLRVPTGTFGDEEEEEVGGDEEARRRGGGAGGFGVAVPFIGIHIRMGDFLQPKYHSFGSLCNDQPDVLLDHVDKALHRFYDAHDKEAEEEARAATSGPASTRGGAARGGRGGWRSGGHGRRAFSSSDSSSSSFKPTGVPLLIATDSPDQPCVTHLTTNYAAGSVLLLSDVNPYHDGTCRRALFDQEVLGYSASFLGDVRSTFSMAIHNIRVLQRGYEVDTTTWLASGLELVRPVQG